MPTLRLPRVLEDAALGLGVGVLSLTTIHLPDFLYDQIRRRAEDAHRSIEAELLDLLLNPRAFLAIQMSV